MDRRAARHARLMAAKEKASARLATDKDNVALRARVNDLANELELHEAMDPELEWVGLERKSGGTSITVPPGNVFGRG